MKIVIAPDSFKGSLTAAEAAAAMAAGCREALSDAEIIQIPMADGGEGTAAALVQGTGGRLVTRSVTGPLGEQVEAAFGLLGDGVTAVVEMAAASGLLLVPRHCRDPRVTTTYGTGQLIQAALDEGATRIVIAIGGSSTNDGGAGMIQALGGRLLQCDGSPIGRGGLALLDLDRIELSGLDPRLANVDLLVACDVDNPLCGPRGASTVYGPQKGATPEMIPVLDQALAHLADVMARDAGRAVAELPGAGAAGGLGAGLMGCLGARLRPGVEVVMEAVGFDESLTGATLAITGEGRTDGQTLAGKVPVGVARRAARHGVPTICISGSLGDGASQLHGQHIAALLSILDCPMSLDEAMTGAARLLERAAAEACRLVALGLAIGVASGRSAAAGDQK